MIAGLIEWSLRNRALVLMLTLLLCLLGWRALQNTPIDAIPDLSDVQVIIKTRYPGQAPSVVDDQISKPLSSAMLAVPGAQTVRSFSFYGDSYVYVIFDEKTDLYWARSRVLEYLNQSADSLPAGAKPQLGPDASGVGWVYIYALSDPHNQHDLSQLRSIQDYVLKNELQALPGVAEVATLGGMIRQYQVQVDPQKLAYFGIPLTHIKTVIQRNNQERGASVIELAEAEYMLRASGYIQDTQALLNLSLGRTGQHKPLLLRDVAEVMEVPAMRRGVADLNGSGEVVGGIIVMRHGQNAQRTINAVKEKLAALKLTLPASVQISEVYDRSSLIQRAVDNLWFKVAQELVLVGAVIFLFLLSVRSVFVVLLTLPIGILISFLAMQVQGLNANIMSLGGIAIAIGAMVDGAIVMTENLHRKLNTSRETNSNHFELVLTSAKELGPTLFFSLLIVTVSFMPVFTLEAEEGRLFRPLAFTKTYAMAAAALLTITLIPALLYFLVKKSPPRRDTSFANQFLQRHYSKALHACLGHVNLLIGAALIIVLIACIPIGQLNSEFMPPLDEGDLMYMPTTYPGISIGKARELLQQSDKLIAQIPEVAGVLGKVGRADTATDPAPLTMIESFIQLKPRSEWRSGVTTQSIIAELEAAVQIPGVTNAWVMPIKTRIDMLATGLKTPLGIKLGGADAQTLQKLGEQLEELLAILPQTQSVYTERSAGGRYVTIDIDRLALARYAMDVAEVQENLQLAVGGISIGETLEGEARYPIQLRYPDAYRQTLEQLEALPIVTQAGQQLRLGDVARVKVELGPPMLKSENARLNTWIYIDVGDNAIEDYIAEAQALIEKNVSWPAGYSLRWAGQFESLERVQSKLAFIAPLTLIIIAILLYINFRRLSDVLILIATLPFALVGGLLLIYFLEFKLSVAVAVGFIALAGLAVETGAIMLQVLRASVEPNGLQNKDQLREKINQAAGQRVRPVIMTAAATIAGLLPMMFGAEPGSEVMSRIAAPVIGGLLSCVLLTLFVIPAVFYRSYEHKLQRA